MKRPLLALLLIPVVAIPALTAGFLGWVLYTSGGLQWLSAQAKGWSDGVLTLEYEAGTLGEGANFAHIHYASPAQSVRAEKVRIRVSPSSLLRLAPHVGELQAAVVRVTMHADQGEPARPLEVPGLPVSLQVDAARIQQLLIVRVDETTAIDDVKLRYGGDASAHRLHDARLRVHGFDIAAAGNIGTSAPYPIDAQVAISRQEIEPHVSARIRTRGNLQRLVLEGEAESAGAHLRADAEIDPAADLPLMRLNAALTHLDVRMLEQSLPHTALSAELALARENGLLDGTVHLSNAAKGPYDAGRVPIAAANARLRTDLKRIDLADLTIDLGTGTLRGSAEVTADRAAVSLTARDVDLAVLHGALHTTRLGGKADAVIEHERQSAIAHLTQDDMRLNLHVVREGAMVTLREAVLHARGGEATARGELALDAQRRFSAAVKLKKFDPAAWGDFPQGAINGSLTGQGTVEGPRASVEFKLSDSRLHNAPLSGAGRASLSAQRISGAEISVQHGNNRAKVSGAFGGANDTLRVQVDVPRLATLHPQLAGRLHGEAQLSGTLKAPQVRFDARTEGLRTPAISIDRATARGTAAREPSAPLRLEARASGLVAANRPVERVEVELTGSQAAHTAAVKAAGKGFDIVARARGGWQPERNRWSGTLLELANRGALDAALESQVAVSAAPEHIAVGPFALRLLDGRIDAAETRYEAGRISTKGRYTRLPVLELAAALQVSPRVGGTLRISGDWSFIQDGALTGALSARREAGDITLGPDGSLPIQLRTLAVDARLDAARLEFKAALASALANAETAGTADLITSDPRPAIGPASPLRFTAKIAIAELSAIAQLFDANVLVTGALNAALAGSGTVGKPLFTGDIRGDRLAVALPPQGIDLKNGTLRAVLSERTVRVDSFSIRGGEGAFTARGNLGLNGADATLDWQAERLLVLGRPDRRLVVSGKGHAGVAGGKLSLTGGVRADDGYFEIGPDALPEPGRDVVIAGRKRTAKEDSGLARMLLELVVNFGENFRVRGRGLETRLAGEITVATGAKGDLRAKGQLRTVRGIYTALGQRLEIERGELVFTGPIDNPGLDILAMRKRQAVEAGVAVTGTLESPLVRIVSEPPVPESEAISWLVLGHGTGDASRGDLAMLPLAASSLLGKGDSPTIAQRFGLDTLGLRGAGTESQALAVGKRIADRLYVGFEQSLGAAASVLKLEFDLTQRVLLRAQTGEANALGIFYRYSFD